MERRSGRKKSKVTEVRDNKSNPDSKLWFKHVSESMFQSTSSPSTSWRRPVHEKTTSTPKPKVNQSISARSPNVVRKVSLGGEETALVLTKLLQEREKNNSLQVRFYPV